MGKNDLIKNYAQALFDNARENKILDKVGQGLEKVNEIIHAESKLYLTITAPTTLKKDQINLLNIIIDNLSLEKILQNFLSILIKNSRLSLLKEITKCYLDLINKDMDIKEVKVISSKKILVQEQTKIKKFLEDKLKTKIKMEYAIDDSLIGGIIFQYDSKILDFSIAGALKRIEKASINILNSI